jgi:hypothetical protein
MLAPLILGALVTFGLIEAVAKPKTVPGGGPPSSGAAIPSGDNPPNDGLDAAMPADLRAATVALLNSATVTADDLDAASQAAAAEGFPLAAKALSDKATVVRAHESIPVNTGPVPPPAPPGVVDPGGPGSFDQGPSQGAAVPSTGDPATDQAIQQGINAAANLGNLLSGQPFDASQVPDVTDSDFDAG